MSQTYGTPSSGGAGSDGDHPSDWTTDSTRDVAAEEARGVAGDVKSAGQQTAATAKDQAAQVAGEAKVQARQVLDQAKQELDQQAQSQHQRAAGGLNALADELTALVQGTGDQQGIAHDLAQQASDRVREAAQWLESRQPREVLEEARSFARRRPGAFLAAAAVAGLVGGRLTRGLADQAREDDSEPATGRRIASGYGTETEMSAIPGQRSYDQSPTGMPPMPATSTSTSTSTATTNSGLDDSYADGLGVDPVLTGTSLDDPLTDTTKTWGGDSSETYGGENR